MACSGRCNSFVVVAVIMSLCWASGLSAEPVDPAQARKVTETFLKAKAVPPGTEGIRAQGFAAEAALAPGGLREVHDDDGTLLAYVADLQPRGFIALAADRDIAPILAYSFQSSFPGGGDPKNPLYRMVRTDMRLRAKALAEHPELKTPEAGRLWDQYAAGQVGRAGSGVAGSQAQISASGEPFQQWPPTGSTSTGGWLETAWDQEPPYNQFCPSDTVDGGRSYVGCAATAIAQILNYHRVCDVTFGPADSYTLYSGARMDEDSDLYDFPSFQALDDYVETIRSRYAEGVDLNDVEAAALSFACGVAMQMGYSSDGSGASPFDAQEALLDKFGFYSADMFGGLSADSYLVLQENVINHLPAMIGLRPADGFGGHAIVCDGYNTDGEYHLNFGWGALYPQKITDVWYRLPTDMYPFDLVITETILNIQPREPALDTDPAFLNFYGVPGQESGTQLLRIRTSVGHVQVNSITCPEGFVVSTSDEFSDHLAGFSLLRPQQVESVLVKFCPQRAGGYYGTLAVHYDDGNVRYVILKGYAFDGGTQVAAGDVSGTWSQDGSPYFVTGDIQVGDDDELTIEPGVQVFFTGPYSLTVGPRARLTAEGTAAHPVELTAWNRDTGWTGLRFLGSGSDDLLSYCTISWAKKTGGFIPTDSAGATEEDSYGGAIYCYMSDPTIENCRLTNNMGDCGGAIYCEYSYPLISNTLIANNTSLGGIPRCGGICAYMNGTPELRNCTIANNSPGGAFTSSWDGMILTNTIVWGNEMYQIQTDESVPEVTFCDVQGGYPGEGNRSADPCFFSPTAGPGIEYDGSAAQWALQSHSPCINAGTDILNLPVMDLAGAARVGSGVLDLGAYENQSELPLMTVSPSVTADAGFVKLGESSTVQLDITNTGSEDFTVQSVSLAGGTGVFSLAALIEDRVLAPGESLPIEVAFSPTREIVYQGKLDIRSTAGNGARVQVALQGTGVSGTVVVPGEVSGTWRKSASPYVVTGDILVSRGKTLTIEPGVTVKFAGHFRLTVGYRGVLRAIGTEQDGIVFTAIDKDEGWYGIRLINSGADDVLQYCTFEYANKPRTGGGSVADLYGGAVLCYGSWDDDPGFVYATSPQIDSCRFVHNYARSGGALACLEDSEAVITKNTFIDNVSDYEGGAIVLYYSAGTIANNVIARNYALAGGGIASMASSPSIANNTIVYNRPCGLDLESALMDYFGNVQPSPITNNIIWGNEIYMYAGAQPDEYEIRFNDIQGGWEGQGNIDQEPGFADPDADDYHLKSQAGRWDPVGRTWVVDAVTSPCIDAGDPASDFATEPQSSGQRVNLGAYGGTDQASKSPGS